MDDFHKLRVLLATILTAGFNADRRNKNGNNSNVVEGLRQADSLLDECGFVHPDLVALGESA